MERALVDSTLPIEVIETSTDGDDVIVVFAARGRPGCRFAFRYGAHEEGDGADADGVGRLAVANLAEELEAADRGLPDCRPGELAWIDI